MDCGMKVVKYLLFGFNLIFFIIALVLIGVGAAVEIKYRDLVQITGSYISSAPILLICVGVFILIIAFFGCCGAYKENYCMVTTFAVLLAIIFVLEISAGIAAFALRNKSQLQSQDLYVFSLLMVLYSRATCCQVASEGLRIETWITDAVKKSIVDYSDDLKPVFNVVQEKFKCCGAESAADWKNSPKFLAEANKIIAEQSLTPDPTLVPDGCCKTVSTNCGLKLNHEIYNGTSEGCVEKIEKFIKSNAGIIGGVGIGIAFIQVVGIIFACCLMRTIKKHYEVV